MSTSPRAPQKRAVPTYNPPLLMKIAMVVTVLAFPLGLICSGFIAAEHERRHGPQMPTMYSKDWRCIEHDVESSRCDVYERVARARDDTQ